MTLTRKHVILRLVPTRALAGAGVAPIDRAGAGAGREQGRELATAGSPGESGAGGFFILYSFFLSLI